VNALFHLTPQAIEDLDGIWWTIAEDNRDAAERVETEILATCHRLANPQCVGEMVICVHEAQHAAQIHRSVTTYSVQNSISDTLSVCPFNAPSMPG
jgi:plasmid stabilization system protein ParE